MTPLHEQHHLYLFLRLNNSETFVELVGAKPLHLLTQTVPSLKSPTGAFIVPLRSTNANLYIKENIDETVFMFALFKCRKSDKGRN